MARNNLKTWLAGPPLLYLGILFLLPVAGVIRYSFLERDIYGTVLPELSAEGWQQALSPIARLILLRSLLLAGGVTLACLLLGYPSALALASLPASTRQLLVLAISFPLVTSLLLRIYGWLNLLPLAWQGTTAAVGLVLTVNYLPFMILPLLRARERIAADLPQAAMDLGATPWQTFWHVTLPLTRGGMAAGCALVFIPVSGEYLVPHFIGAGKVQVIGTLIVEQFEHRSWPFAAAASLALLLVVLAPILLGGGKPDLASTPTGKKKRT